VNNQTSINIGGPLEAAALRVLRKIPGLTVVAEKPRQNGASDPTLKFPGGRRKVVVEFKQRANAATAWQLVHHASMNASKPLLLVAGTTTAEAREILRNHGVNVVDGIGNAHIALPGLFFHVEAPRPNDRDRTTPGRTRLAGKTGAVAQAILLHPDHALRVADVAKDAHVSPSLAHRVLTRLERERLLEAEGRGPKRVRRVINPSELLDLYAEENADRPNRILGHLLAQTPEQLSARLATNLTKAGIDYAITGAAAASVVAPFVTAIPIVELWVRDDAAPKDVHAASGAHPVTEGANVVFLQERADTPLLFRENVNDRWLANRFQIYVDLRRDPRRGKEQADHLRREVIKF
jgi:AraC-like DNA-binding protein